MNLYASTVPHGMEGLDLVRFLRDGWPTAPLGEVRKALKRRDIKLNGRRVSGNCPVHPGDRIEWYTLWQPVDIPVVYEDRHVLVVNKPAGLPTDPQGPGAACLLQWARQRSGASRQARLVHRLDQNTSGLVVLALDEQAEALLLRWFRQRLIVREYTCLVGGLPPQAALLKDYLVKDAAQARVQVFAQRMPQSLEIVTQLRVLNREGEVSRLLVQLHTGRTHQIRAHLAFHGWPILGDDKYGDREWNRRLGCRRLRLAATGLTMPSDDGTWPDIKGRSWRVEAPF